MDVSMFWKLEFGIQNAEKKAKCIVHSAKGKVRRRHFSLKTVCVEYTLSAANHGHMVFF